MNAKKITCMIKSNLNALEKASEKKSWVPFI